MLEFQSVCEFLGVPLAPNKIEGPSQVIVYLGIEIDSINMIIRLPENKLKKLNDELKCWHNRKKCTKRELLSLIGSLSFACKVVKPGRIFLRRMIDLSTSVKKLSHHIDLNRDAKDDIDWWVKFLPGWNGREIIQSSPISSSDLCLFTDASGCGLGGVFGNKWFSTPIRKTRSVNIAFLELLAIYIAVCCWGRELINKQIVLRSDNEAIVHVWCSGSCKDRDIMIIIRKLFFITASLNINLLIKHIAGKDNNLADLLSRLQVEKFKEVHPNACKEATVIPNWVWDI